MSTSKKSKGKTARQKAGAEARQAEGIVPKKAADPAKLPKSRFSNLVENPKIILVSD